MHLTRRGAAPRQRGGTPEIGVPSSVARRQEVGAQGDVSCTDIVLRSCSGQTEGFRVLGAQSPVAGATRQAPPASGPLDKSTPPPPFGLRSVLALGWCLILCRNVCLHFPSHHQEFRGEAGRDGHPPPPGKIRVRTAAGQPGLRQGAPWSSLPGGLAGAPQRGLWDAEGGQTRPAPLSPRERPREPPGLDTRLPGCGRLPAGVRYTPRRG